MSPYQSSPVEALNRVINEKWKFLKFAKSVTNSPEPTSLNTNQASVDQMK